MINLFDMIKGGERLTPGESEKPEKTYSSITLTRQQTTALLKIFAQDFLPSNSSIQTIILNASLSIANPQVCEDKKTPSLNINPQNFLDSLGKHYQPKTNPHPSLLGSGENGMEAANLLTELSREFETVVLSKENFQAQDDKDFKKLPLELQLLLLPKSEDLKQLIDNNGFLFFVKRRKIPDEIVNIIYQLSRYTGRRLDWVDDWFISKENGNSFDSENYFGRLNDKEKKEVNDLLAKLGNLSRYFFQLYYVDKDGNVDKDLEGELNSPFQDIENSYRNLLITQADLKEELKTTQWAFFLSIPTLFAIDQFVETHPILARSIPPALADILALWAQASPFINRNLPSAERLKEFARLIKDNYKASVLSSLILSLAGSQLVKLLENANQLIAAGFAYAFIPFVGALITTYQSFLQEYQQGKELRKKAVESYEGLTDSKLALESLLKTVKHPARLYLLLAGFLGIGEGITLGVFNLLNNPLALTFVGELNESVLATIGLFFHQRYHWTNYHRQFKKLIQDQ